MKTKYLLKHKGKELYFNSLEEIDKDDLEQLVQGGTETLLNAVFVSLCSIGAIIALIAILIIK